jgi:glycyl-tRNA synthetase alpha chain
MRDFSILEKEALALVKKGLYLPAYDLALKCVRNYQLLQVRLAVPECEKTALCRRARALTQACAAAYLKKHAGGRAGGARG